MKGFSLVLLLLVATQLFAQQIENLSPKVFKEKMASMDHTLLDVRTLGEVNRSHLKNTSVINLSDAAFAEKVNMLPKDKPVFVYCASGARSASAAKYMAGKGFKKIYNLQGGIMAWYNAGYEVESNQPVGTVDAESVSSSDFKNLTKGSTPVLVDFHAPWCAPCKKMLPEVEKLEKELNGKLKLVKVNVDVNKALAKELAINSVPALKLYKNGSVVWESNKGMTYEELLPVVKKYLN